MRWRGKRVRTLSHEFLDHLREAIGPCGSDVLNSFNLAGHPVGLLETFPIEGQRTKGNQLFGGQCPFPEQLPSVGKQMRVIRDRRSPESQVGAVL